MSALRYPQFCALARAAELLSERWTLLVIRELLLGPKRFGDLRARLDGISTSVLSERLARLEETGLVGRTALPPPAASTTVYELSADGRALEPALLELLRWGARFLLPGRPGERVEPDWVRLALAAFARRTPTPPCALQIRIPGEPAEVAVHVTGGRQGTSVGAGERPAQATITADARTVLGLMSGGLSPAAARRRGLVRVEGDGKALALLPDLFTAAAPHDVEAAARPTRKAGARARGAARRRRTR